MTYEIHITHRCNFKCPACCALCNVVNDITSDMDMNEVEEVVRQINDVDRGSKGIRVIGGEPTLHPQCYEICRYIKNNITNIAWLSLATNHTNNTLADKIKNDLSFGVQVDDRSVDPATVARNRAKKHWSFLISPKEEGLPIGDPYQCYALTSKCGFAVHKWRGKLAWSWCGNGAAVAKLLRREDMLAPTLYELLGSGFGKWARIVCENCSCIAYTKFLACEYPDLISPCFVDGLRELREYNEKLHSDNYAK